jgi:hypothetical protein
VATGTNVHFYFKKEGDNVVTIGGEKIPTNEMLYQLVTSHLQKTIALGVDLTVEKGVFHRSTAEFRTTHAPTQVTIDLLVVGYVSVWDGHRMRNAVATTDVSIANHLVHGIS